MSTKSWQSVLFVDIVKGLSFTFYIPRLPSAKIKKKMLIGCEKRPKHCTYAYMQRRRRPSARQPPRRQPTRQSTRYQEISSPPPPFLPALWNMIYVRMHIYPCDLIQVMRSIYVWCISSSVTYDENGVNLFIVLHAYWSRSCAVHMYDAYRPQWPKMITHLFIQMSGIACSSRTS